MKYKVRQVCHDSPWNGTCKERSSTNSRCLIVLIVFIGCWFAVGIYAFIAGDIKTFFAPTNSQGKKCGIDSAVSDKPYLIFFDLTKCNKSRCDTRTLCSATCPSKNWYFEVGRPVENISKDMLCVPNVSVSNKSAFELQQLIKNGACAPWYMESSPIVGRCFPKNIPAEFSNASVTRSMLMEAREAIDLFSPTQRVTEKLMSTKLLVIMFIVASSLMSFIYIILLRWIALLSTYTAIVGICGYFSYLALLCIESYAVNKLLAWNLTAIALIILVGVIITKIYTSWEKIDLACQLLQEASRAVLATKTSLLIPFLALPINIAIFAYSTNIIPNLGIIGTSLCDPSLSSQKCDEDNVLPVYIFTPLIIIHVAGEFIIRKFMFAFQYMTLAVIFSDWYWQVDKSQHSNLTAFHSMWAIIRYHLGTVAYGSIFTLTTGIFRIFFKILLFLSKKPKFPSILSCSRFLTHVETTLKIVTADAYIFCAIHGTAFWESATDASSFNSRKIIRMGMLNKVIVWPLLAGRIFVTCTTAELASWYFTDEKNYDVYFWVPILFVVVGTLTITEVFFNVLVAAVDTIFMNFLNDCERNDNLVEKLNYTNKIQKIIFLKQEKSLNKY